MPAPLALTGAAQHCVSSHNGCTEYGGQTMNRAAAIALLVCSLLFPTSGHLQEQKPVTAQSAPQAKSDPTSDPRLHASQAEVQVMKDFTQHILSTVYFALGTVLVVLIAMIGFGLVSKLSRV
jgi:hypothetical protein